MLERSSACSYWNVGIHPHHLAVANADRQFAPRLGRGPAQPCPALSLLVPQARPPPHRLAVAGADVRPAPHLDHRLPAPHLDREPTQPCRALSLLVPQARPLPHQLAVASADGRLAPHLDSEPAKPCPARSSVRPSSCPHPTSLPLRVQTGAWLQIWTVSQPSPAVPDPPSDLQVAPTPPPRSCTRRLATSITF
eukprot:365613-Chlamydomonas_euryale.AAC.4